MFRTEGCRKAVCRLANDFEVADNRVLHQTGLKKAVFPFSRVGFDPGDTLFDVLQVERITRQSSTAS